MLHSYVSWRIIRDFNSCIISIFLVFSVEAVHVRHLYRMCGLGKVKWSRYRPSVAQKVGRGIALLFHDRGNRRGWVVSNTPRPHFTPGKDPVPILQEAGWAPGLVWTGGKSRPHRDSMPDRPAHSSVAIPNKLPSPCVDWVLVQNIYYGIWKFVSKSSNNIVFCKTSVEVFFL